MAASLVWLVAVILIILAVEYKLTHQWQQEAAAHGAAHYILDPKTGASKWEWKTPEKRVEK